MKGSELKELRRRLGYSQARAAALLAVSRQRWARAEHSEHPHAQSFNRVAARALLVDAYGAELANAARFCAIQYEAAGDVVRAADIRQLIKLLGGGE